MSLKIKKLVDNAKVPTRATPGSVGYDLYSTEDHIILPGHRAVISTGIQIGLPPGTYGRIAPKSGQSVKHGIHVGAGVIDQDYSGELKVVLFNLDTKKTFVVRQGYRIAQLVLEKVDLPDVEEVYDIQYYSEIRGDGGFGSTGNC